MTDRPRDSDPVRALAEAATAALNAPSVHNTQPWRWVVRAGVLELYGVPGRQLHTTDPDGHLLLLSCGAALHHARLALTAEAWAYEVDRSPDPAALASPLARIRPTARTAVDPTAMRHFQTTLIRHTDRRVVTDEPVKLDAVEAIRAAVGHEGCRSHLARPDDLLRLALAVERAGAVEALDPGRQAELAAWIGGRREGRTGVPDSAIPAAPAQTTVPGRDFGRAGTLATGAGHGDTAVFLVLYGDRDEPIDWLRAGEALSAAWLTATERGLVVVPFSAPIEVLETRQALRHVLADLGYPYLVLRIGVPDPDVGGAPHTPRLPADDVIEIID